MAEIAVSSWSLHRTLGPTYHGLAPDGERPRTLPYGEGDLTLLDLPAALAAHGIRHLEVCHFHFPRTDAAYLRDFRECLAAAGVTLTTLLIDTGDISAADPASRERDLAAIRAWIDVAAALGARRVRVVTGEGDPSDAEAVGRSIAGLAALAAYGRARGVATITENWRRLGDAPTTLLAVLDGAGGAVGLCADFGNLAPAGKEDALRLLLPRAATVHAKAEWADGRVDRDDFLRCLDLAREAGFAGEYVLIFDGPQDEWAGLAELATLVRPYAA